MQFVPSIGSKLTSETQENFSVTELRAPIADSFSGGHVLEGRVKNWEKSQDAVKLEIMQRVYGPGEPIRYLMERETVSQGAGIPEMARVGSDLHLDILMNRDAGLLWEDVYQDDCDWSIHRHMEAKFGLDNKF